MKTASVVCTLATFLSLASAAFAQKTLDSEKARSILKELTSQPRKTWISAGTIQATHHVYGAAKVTDEAVIKDEIDKAVQEYQKNADKSGLASDAREMMLLAIPFNVRYELANEYSMTSQEIVKYDGERFYWEIRADPKSRTDSVKPDATLAANTMTDEFDMAWNKHKIFAWDGQKYTMYTDTDDGGHATIDAAGKFPRAVNGPLTAGLIPWGYGMFSDASLASATVTATETALASAGSLRMTITHANGALTELTLDPSKDYAVTSAKLAAAGDYTVTYACSGYQSIGGRWVPSSVSIERTTGSLTSKAPTTELWTDIKVTSTSVPLLGGFNVPVGLNALVEYVSPVTASSALYVNSYETDVDELLAQRMAYGAGEGLRRQNCATAALQYVASQFRKPVSSATLANLVGPDGRTSVYDLKQSAQRMGLYSRVVKTDLAGLENLGAAKAILHIPGKDHFVVIDHVDDQYVWVIDLSERKFYYRQSVHFFPLEWTEGTALLLSDRPISGRLNTISDAATRDIAGGQTYDCNRLMQEQDYLACSTSSTLCLGSFIWYWERWSCGLAESGTCAYQPMVRKQTSPCIPEPYFTCIIDGEWNYYNMMACK